ncbi:hypothetical protein CFAM422_010138 [Trichoderma lentiforme]|uniref:Uncharacterized protein n=1 Tax=Trichoderma lentiforme TaxID=1567552 RepID=A0A9P4X9I7_9HYPO|nr:hypothetical protein CFAM422_010138 [Trichoderma lentiforme]
MDNAKRDTETEASSPQLARVLPELIETLQRLIEAQERLSNDSTQSASQRFQKGPLDLVGKALDEEFHGEQLKNIPKWAEVQTLSLKTIDQENDAYIARYEEFWKGREGTATEIETTNKAYQSAFEHFQHLYHCLGWRENEGLIIHYDDLCESRPFLIESIFAIEAYRMKRLARLQEPTRASFEYSRLPRLLLILIRIESRQNMQNKCRRTTDDGTTNRNDNNEGMKASTILAVLIQVARTMDRISWADGLNQMSLQELLRICYSHRVLEQPRSNDPERQYEHMQLLADCLMALDFTHRFREIRPPLSRTFYFRYLEEPIHKILDMVIAHDQNSRGIDHFKQLRLQESASPTFIPEHFTIQYLQDFGNLEIEWTDCLDEHLKIYSGRNAIRIFAHPTFFYNCIDLFREGRDYVEPTFKELSLTYALLFRPSSKRKLNTLNKLIMVKNSSHGCVTFAGHETPHFYRARKYGEYENMAAENIDLDISRNPTKGLLDNFFRCSLPPSLQAAFNISQPTKTIQKTHSRDQHKTTQATMQQILALASCPEDIKFMVISLLQRDFGEFEAFQAFPYFGSRLRQLKSYLDAHQPRTWLQLWRDDRDIRAWWMFWTFMGFVCSIIPACIAVIILQAVYLARFYYTAV